LGNLEREGERLKTLEPIPTLKVGQPMSAADRFIAWCKQKQASLQSPTTRDYETVSYVISGSVRLNLEGQTLKLKAGDSWLVPAGAMHQYTIIDPFTAVEATAPPAEVHGRDAPA
jgi:quercetin dioxygenase-like cupin family protein